MTGGAPGSRFPRGNGPCVAVLIPTRGRPDRLERAVRSLHDTARGGAPYEILLRIDDDDAATLDRLRDTSLGGLVSAALCGPRGGGYLDIHHHLHAMIEASSADWFLIFNDDSVMKTPGWNQYFVGQMKIRGGGDETWAGGWPDGIFLLILHVPSHPDSPEIFAVHRRVYEVLGHLSPNMGADLWLHFVLRTLGRASFCPLVVEHEDDEDETWREGRATVKGELSHELTASISVLRGRLADVVKLIDYMENFAKGGVG